LVFVECMACRTPVIGANSGGPKDFVSPEVGMLVDEPPETKDLSTVADGVKTLGNTLNTAITTANSQIDGLVSDIGKHSGKSAELEATIKQVEKELAANIEALDTATAVRKKA